MDILYELRYPSSLPAKIVVAVLALGLLTLLGVGAASTFLLYRVVSPLQTSADLDSGSLMGRPSDVSFTVPGGGTHEGWFFPGLTNAPTILLCHGYRSHRTQILALVSALQEHQYNVFVFDFTGHGRRGGLSSLGYNETAQVLGALESIASRDDVDRTRFGIWGADMGGYAAIAAAAKDARIRAVAVDSVYNSPYEMLRIQIDRTGLSNLPLVWRIARLEFYLLNLSHRNDPGLSQNLSGLAGIPKLFIQARDSPRLAESARQLFLQAPEPRAQALVAKANFSAMLDEEAREYENYVVNFFLQNLPKVSASPTPAPKR